MMALGHLIVTPSKRLFTGREKELAQLHHLSQKRPRPILISGPPGIGKTALVLMYVSSNYSAQEAAYLDIEKAPDPYKLIYDFAEQLQQHPTRVPAIVILDGTERLSGKELEDSFYRLLNFKLIRTVIGTTRPTDTRFKGARYIE